MTRETEIASQWDKHKKITSTGIGSQYDNTRACIAFYNGDTMAYNDKIQFSDDTGRRRAAAVQFNKVKPPVDAVAGRK